MEIFQGDPSNEILKLNVGGTMVCVRRCVLIQVNDSMMATQFSGRWDEGAKQQDRDGSSSFFIPYPYNIFKPLVDLLSVRFYVPGCEKSRLSIEDFDGKAYLYRTFLHLTEHYGLLEAFYGPLVVLDKHSVYLSYVEPMTKSDATTFKGWYIPDAIAHEESDNTFGKFNEWSQMEMETRDATTYGIQSFTIHNAKRRAGIQRIMRIGWINRTSGEFEGFQGYTCNIEGANSWTVMHFGDLIILKAHDSSGSEVLQAKTESCRIANDPRNWVAVCHAGGVHRVSDIKLSLLYYH